MTHIVVQYDERIESEANGRCVGRIVNVHGIDHFSLEKLEYDRKGNSVTEVWKLERVGSTHPLFNDYAF
jgi:hypothetical protein